MLKAEFGYQFTLKLERMLADMVTSQETMQGFYWAHDAELVNTKQSYIGCPSYDDRVMASPAHCHLQPASRNFSSL